MFLYGWEVVNVVGVGGVLEGIDGYEEFGFEEGVGKGV